MRNLLAILAGVLALVPGPSAVAQSLEERLDHDQFLRELIDLDVPEILDHYLKTHGPADPAQIAQIRISIAIQRMHAEPPTSKKRERALELVLEARGEQIRSYPDHPDHAIWLADQASDLLLELLPIDASGLSTLFALPSPGQRARAERVARRMNEFMIQAELEIERAIVKIESTPNYRENEALRRQRRRLVRDERDRRIPFLRGVAACLYAEIDAKSVDERREHHAIAVQMLEPLTNTMSGLAARRANLYCGLALVRRAEYAEAETLLDRVRLDSNATPSEVFAAQACATLSHIAQRGPEAGLARLDALLPRYAGPGNLFFRVLLTDQRYLIERERRKASRTSPKDHPVNVYVRLLESEHEVPRETVRAIILEKIAEAVASASNLRELPAIATIARADRLSRDERRAPEALMLFEQALSRLDLDGGDRAVALFGLGRVLHGMNRPGAAARRFLQIAAEHPADDHAERAVEIAASILHRLYRKHPSDERVRLALEECLKTLLDGYQGLPTIGRWQYVAGELALDAGDLEEAGVHFASITPNEPDYPDAEFMQVNLRRAAIAADESRGTDRGAHSQLVTAAERAQRIITDAIANASGERKRDLQYYVAHLRVFRAQSLFEIGEPSAAIEALRGLEREPGGDGASLAAALRVRIAAYQATGRADDARDEILRFMGAAPDQSGAVLDSMLALTLRDIETLFAQGRSDEAHARARDEGLPLASLLQEWIAAHATPAELRDRYLTHVATIYQLGGKFADGLAIFDRLAVNHADTVEILFGRAECLFGLGSERLSDAMVIYKRLVAGGPGIGHAYYWQSQLRMLLVLDRVQKNTDKIVPRINRLKMGDETLGGARFRPQFERLANKYL